MSLGRSRQPTRCWDRSRSGDWRRLRPFYLTCASIAGSPRPSATKVLELLSLRGQPNECTDPLETVWNRESSGALARGREATCGFPRLDPDEWLVRSLRPTPSTRRRGCDTPRAMLTRPTNPRPACPLIPGGLCPLTDRPLMSGTSLGRAPHLAEPRLGLAVSQVRVVDQPSEPPCSNSRRIPKRSRRSIQRGRRNSSATATAPPIQATGAPTESRGPNET